MGERKTSSYVDEFTIEEQALKITWFWDKVYRMVVFKARTFRFILLLIAGYVFILIAFYSLRILHSGDSSSSSSTPVCEQHANVAFIKTHKAGSTTVANVLLRYAFLHHLSVVLPNTPDKVWLGWPGPFNKSFIQAPYQYSVRGENYNILAHHAVYNEKTMSEVMPPNTVYISILRQPFENFKSAFHNYRVPLLLNISGPTPFADFLMNPYAYERLLQWDSGRDAVLSLTKNLMTADLGLPATNYTNAQGIQDYLQYIDSKFHLILIMEYFEESMILLKRLLCWKMEHILYLEVTTLDSVSAGTVMTPNDDDWNPTGVNVTLLQESHRQWSTADYIFYDHFNRTLWEKISEEGEDFMQEVGHYKDMLGEVRDYCEGSMDMTKYFPRTPWNDDFYMTSRYCNLMRLNDLHFTDIFTTLRARQT